MLAAMCSNQNPDIALKKVVMIALAQCANLFSYPTFCCDLRLSKCASHQRNFLDAGGNRRSKQKVG